MHVKPSFFRARRSSQPVGSSWTMDHAEPGGKSSMGVLLDWLAVPNNYSRWCSASKSNTSRSAVADEIVRLLHDAGLTDRTPAQVVIKIAELERAYREAAERLTSTKRELQAAQGTPAEQNLHRVLERHCRYFALLQPIMKDKTMDSPSPKTRPRLTTKRKIVRAQPPPVVTDAAPARKLSPSPVRSSSYQLRERRVVGPITEEEESWEFDDGSSFAIKSPPSPPTPPTPPTVTARRQRKTRTRVMESISVMQLEEEQEEQRPDNGLGLARPAALRSMEDIDLEKARVELTLRQLEVQMARDKAIVMRAKARAELLEQGVSSREIDRLMPLGV